jgi:hypothetical protein
LNDEFYLEKELLFNKDYEKNFDKIHSCFFDKKININLLKNKEKVIQYNNFYINHQLKNSNI